MIDTELNGIPTYRINLSIFSDCKKVNSVHAIIYRPGSHLVYTGRMCPMCRCVTFILSQSSLQLSPTGRRTDISSLNVVPLHPVSHVNKHINFALIDTWSGATNIQLLRTSTISTYAVVYITGTNGTNKYFVVL